MKFFSIFIALVTSLNVFAATRIELQEDAVRIQALKLTPQFGDILKNADGSINYMTYDKALSACPTGSHLPTARELAQYSHTLGANSILEPGQIGNYPPSGYDMVKATNPDKTKDEFYFNYTGYQRPAGDLGNNRFWSSSVSSDSSGYAYLFNGIYGFVAYELRDFNFAVRCVRRQ